MVFLDISGCENELNWTTLRAHFEGPAPLRCLLAYILLTQPTSECSITSRILWYFPSFGDLYESIVVLKLEEAPEPPERFIKTRLMAPSLEFLTQ
jgi:hypothetical protein